MGGFYPFNDSTLSLVLSAATLIFIFVLPTARAASSSLLSPGKSLPDGATLVSPGDIFELGFFSPGNSTKRYVGIWYRDFSTSTVLWVANRDSPVLDNSGSLAIADDGNLVILDGLEDVVWSSKVASFPSNESAAELLDNGNLMLNSSGSIMWQSFDHPTDTYLPGMKVGLDLITNVNQFFTSWRSLDDPATGNFSMGIAPDQSTQIFIWEGSKPRWRSGRWDGQVFIGIQNMVPTYIYGFKLSNFEQEKKMYFYYTQFNSSHRYILNPDGIERHLVWANDTKNWHQFWAQPITQCEIYNRCGNNASCTDSADGNSPTCNCLKGFELKSENSSDGCVRRTPLLCERNNGSAASAGGKPDGFYLMQGVKLPDLSQWLGPSIDSECEEACLMNCSCKAYSFVTGIGCLMWGRDLVDIHLFSSGGNDFYLRLAGSEFDDNKKGLEAYVIVIILLSAVALMVGGIFLIWMYKSRMEEFYRRVIKRQESLVDGRRSGGGGDPSTDFSAVIDMHEQGKGGRDVSLFSFETIEEATQSFSSSNLLGEGGFGPVYKGMLPGGQEIAVKRLSKSSGQGMEEFKNEVILIAKLQHRNLVRLLGYCMRWDDKMLVYEYMPNRSLDACLFNASRKLSLDWNTRYSIIEGVARGLLYLHRDSRLRVIHRDLKASNILLDEQMNPKISDFGMARIFGNDGNETSTKRVVGTYGYMSPEYAMQGLFSVKSDVYSFGVLLIEIVSGKRNSTYYNSELSLNLLGYAWKLWNEDNVMELVDSSIRSSCSVREVSRCVNVGLLCIQDRANDRPTMSSVIVMLEGENCAHPMPRQPKFAADISQSETDSSTLDQKIASADNSITMLTGR
ncbi:G-type lectin S-receptor-like serine/threonine-protein kinase B120 isoform X2 [Phalaenopsis equestris]|uniref:G-type lectin S-receptor-like serine/threonine-protein kinase B120 isoform X2 n=1 Tax=Phalaenopsis equestris TaxID=78828 RepID=UPI0009E3718A|nr:G-type lectin S-receptor-like serine/threonine-protein kinase B120 isoform X2 [Phalaenopsis equestris]